AVWPVIQCCGCRFGLRASPTRRSSDLDSSARDTGILRGTGRVKIAIAAAMTGEGAGRAGGPGTGGWIGIRLSGLGLQIILLPARSEEHTSELQTREIIVCHLLMVKYKA